MKKRGKKYVEASKLVDPKMAYSVDEAIALLKKTAVSKFDSSCELHMRLNVDPKQAEQLVRSTVALPKGTGKKVRVIAFVNDDRVKEAEKAGAIKAGLDTLIDEIVKGFMDFDVAVATPDVMKNLGKVAKVLGTKGLMPNPKAGTVTPDLEKTIEEIIRGKVEFRTDKQAQIHLSFGKASFSEADLKENFKALTKAIVDSKPSTIKGAFINNVSLATTMGPGIKLDISKLLAELK